MVEHKHKIGFKGTLLIEPKPQSRPSISMTMMPLPFTASSNSLVWKKEIKLNIELTMPRSPAIRFHHEIATAIAPGLFGSVDANRGDPQLGWDTTSSRTASKRTRW